MHLVDLVESVPVGRPLSYKSWRLVFELFLCVAFVIVMMIKRYIYIKFIVELRTPAMP